MNKKSKKVKWRPGTYRPDFDEDNKMIGWEVMLEEEGSYFSVRRQIDAEILARLVQLKLMLEG